MMLHDSSPLPLAQMRVLDCCDRIGQSCGRFLGDLGAVVILLEPEAGMDSRQRPPLHNGESLYFATHNANKKSVVVDLQSEQGREQFLALVKSADLLIDGGELTGRGISHQEVRAANPQLLLLSITDFGLTGPYKDFIATEAVHAAMGGMLNRSGIDGREPLLPPGEMSYETASIQAAWVALLAYWQRQKIGKGDLLDFSVNDAGSQLIYPAIGATGSAAAGRTPIEVAIRGRPILKRIPGEMPSLALL
jgi:crotonobetainyl-CoA:carnitine CoA-transferase CaiB-like acyl-CoA transferase